MNSATYFTGFETKELFVIEEHKDGTVDLANEAGEIIVSKCPVSDIETAGHCQINDDPKSDHKASAKGK